MGGKKRSDALTALVHELVDLQAQLAGARAREEEARTEWVAARQVLDSEGQKRQAIEDRIGYTESALDQIASRDQISDETLAALKERAAA